MNVTDYTMDVLHLATSNLGLLIVLSKQRTSRLSHDIL